MGLQGMINDVLERSDFDFIHAAPKEADAFSRRSSAATAARSPA